MQSLSVVDRMQGGNRVVALLKSPFCALCVTERGQEAMSSTEQDRARQTTLMDSLYFHLRSPAGTTTEHCLHFTGQDHDHAVLLPLSVTSFSEDASQKGQAR